MAYSIETRVNALKDCVNGQTDEQVSAKHGVSTYTISIAIPIENSQR
jgi:hypothetical protein